MDGSDIGKTTTPAEDDEISPCNTHILEFDIEVPSLDSIQSSDFLEEELNPNVVPNLGMEFDSDDQAYDFYCRYARLNGFAVNISKANGDVVCRRFTCSKGGFVQKDERDVNGKKQQNETRTSCLAQMIISRQSNGKYIIAQFEANHNHEVEISNRASSLSTQRSSPVARVANGELENTYGEQQRSDLECVGGQVEGQEDCSYIPIDCKSYLRSRSMTEMNEVEANCLLDYLRRQQLEDPSFYYAVQLDINNHLTNIFWADTQMMVDYGHFGDMICFDTTYRTSKNCRPFAPFIGVNHHIQTVFFGAALLYDETFESFEWLFRTFVAAMSGQKPKIILTDQDATIDKAVKSVLPETCHRICVWQIYQNALIYLSHAFNGPGSFAKDFSSCIYDYEDEEEFIHAWKEMLSMYNLQQNEWLTKIYKERVRWATAYARHIFYANMEYTRLSEGFRRSFKDYMKPNLDMLQFLTHFERAVADQRWNELEASYDIFERLPALMGNVIMLKHARDVYTPKVFEVFQREYEKCLNLIVNQCNSSTSLFEYKVSIYGQSRAYTVTFNSSNDTVVCNCTKFEFDGVLCSHAIKVLDQRNIKVVPTQYILKRWTKDARVVITENYRSIVQEDPMLSAANLFKMLCCKAARIATMASESEEAYQHVKRRFGYMMQVLENISNIKPYKNTQPADDSGLVDGREELSLGDEYDSARDSSMATCNLNISSNLVNSADLLMLHNDDIMSKTPERSPGLETIPTGKMCTACKSTVSSTWRYGPKGPRTLCNACGLRYKKEHMKLWETALPHSKPSCDLAKRRKSSTKEF